MRFYHFEPRKKNNSKNYKNQNHVFSRLRNEKKKLEHFFILKNIANLSSKKPIKISKPKKFS